MRIDITRTPGVQPTLTVNGEPLDSPTFRWERSLDLPHSLVWVDGRRMYDVEVWVNGSPEGAVPEQSAAVDGLYDAAG